MEPGKRGGEERRSDFVGFRELGLIGARLPGVKELHAELSQLPCLVQKESRSSSLPFLASTGQILIFIFSCLSPHLSIFSLAVSFPRDGPSVASQGRLFRIKIFLLTLALASLSYCVHPFVSHLKAPLLLVLAHLEYLGASILVIAFLAPLIPALVV